MDTLQEANTELTEKQLASKKQHENEIEKLVSTYNASQAVLKKQLSDSVNEKNNMLKQSSKKEMELKRAKEELNNSATSIDTLRLAEQTNSQLEQELVQLKTETAERNQDYEARMEKLRLEVLEKAGEVDKLRLELNVLQSKADDATSVAPITETVSTVQHNALRKELEVAQDKIRLQETSAAGVTAQLESVQSQLQKEMTSNAQASEELRKLKETNLALQENIKSITAGVSVPANAEQSSSSIDVTVHESEIAHLKANFESKLKLIQQELQNSSELHDMKDASISKYQCDALQLHGQILEKANAVSELMQEVNRLKAEIAVSTPVAVATDKCFSALECSNKIHEVEMQYTEVRF